jgi:hypothetical protein
MPFPIASPPNPVDKVSESFLLAPSPYQEKTLGGFDSEDPRGIGIAHSEGAGRGAFGPWDEQGRKPEE